MEMEELQTLLKHWQRELRLDHWDIQMRYAAIDEIPGHGQSCAARYHRAQILLIDPKDRTADAESRFRLDYEVIVVHELLHIQESIWRDNPKVEDVLDKDEWIRRCHENTMDATAEALVRARRGMTR